MGSIRLVALCALLTAAPSLAAAQTFIVTTTADCTSCGSLRDAVAAVNAGTANVINATGVSGTIVLASALPTIVNAVTINAPSGGTLSVSGGASGQVVITTTASVTMNQLRVADALTKAGSGTLTLLGPQSYSGGTTILEGRLSGYGGNHLDQNASIQGTVVNFGVLELVRQPSGSPLGTSLGARTIASISGPGSVVAIGSTWLHTGVNTYTGGTFISGGNVAGNLSTLQGDFTLDGLGGVDFVQIGTLDGVYAGNITSRNAPSFWFPVIVDIGGGRRVTFTGTLDVDGDMSVASGTLRTSTFTFVDVASQYRMAVHGTLEFAQDFDGVFSRGLFGTGTLVKSGLGTVTLTGNTVATSLRTIVNGGTLRASTATWNSFQTTLNNGTLELSQNTDGVAAGNISGTGSFVKSGSGTVTFTGTNTYSGGTVVSGGMLAGSTQNLQGAILNNARVTFVQPDDGTYAGVMSGTGTLSKSGIGTLTLSSANSYTGGTFIDAGTLRMGASQAVGAGPVSVGGTWDLNGFGADVSAISGTGTVALGSGTLTVGRGGATMQFAGTITGSGSLTKTGAGTLTLRGANTYAGVTFLSGGALQFFSDNNLGASSGHLTVQNGTLVFGADLSTARNVVLNGAATFDASQASAQFSGAITGSGSLSKIGQGTLILSGTSTYSGGTSVLNGVLWGTSKSLQGSIFNNAIVVFDQTDAGTFAGTMSGSGSVLKTGIGALTFLGPHTYTGLTQISAGTLTLEGSIAGDVYVQSGGSLTGTGRVGGSLFIEGAYEVSVAGNTVSGLSVDRAVVLNGASLRLTPVSSDVPARRSSVTVLRAAGISGGFGTLSSIPGFSSHLIYQPAAVHVFLLRDAVPFSQYTASSNGVGAALESLQASAAGDLQFVLRELRALDSDEALSSALARLSGKSHAAFTAGAMLGAMDAFDIIGNRFRSPSGWWLQASGVNMSLAPAVDPGESRVRSAVTFAGVDRNWRRVMAGAAAGYATSGMDASAGLDSHDDRVYRGALYGAFDAGRLVVESAMSTALHRARGTRTLAFAAHLDPQIGSGLLFGGVDRTAASRYGAFEIGWHADAGLRLPAGRFVFRPAVGLQAVRISRDAFDETGAESLNLSSPRAVFTSTGFRAQLYAERQASELSRFRIVPRMSIRMTSEVGSRAVTFAGALAESPFLVRESVLPARTLAVKAGAAGSVGGWPVSLDYRALFAGGTRHHLLSLGITF